MPLTQQQDVRRLDAFECFEEEPLREGVERVVGGDLLRGGGWKETQKVEAGTVELEVSWNLKHKPVSQTVLPEQALHTASPTCGSRFQKKRVKCARAGRETWLGMTCLSCVSPSS